MKIMEHTNDNIDDDTDVPAHDLSPGNNNVLEVNNSENKDTVSESSSTNNLEKEDECLICIQPMGETRSILNSCNHEICTNCIEKIKNHNFNDYDKKYFQCPFDRIVNLTATTAHSNYTMKLLPDSVVHIIDECDKIRESSKFKFKKNYLIVNKELFKIKTLHDTGFSNVNPNLLSNLSDDHLCYFINLKQNSVRYSSVDRKDWRSILNELESLSSILIESYLPWIYIISNFSKIVEEVQNDNAKISRLRDTTVTNNSSTNPEVSGNKADDAHKNTNSNNSSNDDFIKTDSIDIQQLKKSHNDFVVEYLYKFIIESYVILTTSIFQYDLFEGDDYLEVCPLSFKRHPYRRCLICFSKFDDVGYVKLECCEHKICLRCIKLGHYFMYICPLHSKKYSFQRIIFANNNGCVKELQLALLCLFNKTLDLEAQLIEYILRDISIYAQVVRLIRKAQLDHRHRRLSSSEKTLLLRYLNDWVILDMENEKKMLSFLNYVFLISFSHQCLIMCWQYIMEAKRFIFEWIFKQRKNIHESVLTFFGISDFVELQEYERDFVIWFSILQGSSAEICVLNEELRQSYPDGDYLYFDSDNLYDAEEVLDFSTYLSRFSIIRDRKKLLECYNLYPISD